ncbi:Rap1a/Tai family immunity protein [Microbulbifer sp. HZ11]|uniref:Rap1a/Tai family immunity protein n=1 Tax=unclassified Microbulbifer TaxID=2619833 RepID=UPI0005B8CAA1|nr:Rap1a/Tai family immunity protein [Microbulbifer sp. HZ11]
MKQQLRSVIAPAAVAALTIGLTSDVLAEPLTATELIEACKSHQVDQQSAQATSCRAFIHGYLSASRDIVAADERPSEFVARAIRTRASRLSDDAAQRLSSRYCLPEAATLDTLIGKVSELSQPFAEEATAESAMLTVFENHYRCKKDVPNP